MFADHLPKEHEEVILLEKADRHGAPSLALHAAAGRAPSLPCASRLLGTRSRLSGSVPQIGLFAAFRSLRCH